MSRNVLRAFWFVASVRSALFGKVRGLIPVVRPTAIAARWANGVVLAPDGHRYQRGYAPDYSGFRTGRATSARSARSRARLARILILCRLTIHSSRPRFAGRLNSGVRPLVLGSVVAGFRASCGIALIRSVCTSHARERHRWSLVTQLGFGQARLPHKYDHPESASCGLAVRVLSRARREI